MIAINTISMKSIYIIGAQSTGKTTLVNALAEAFQKQLQATGASKQTPTVIKEIARTIVQREAQFSREAVAATPERALRLQHRILAAQYDAEIAISHANTPVPGPEWYISDRSGLDPIVYARCLVGKEAAADMLATTAWQELESRMKAGLVILCEAGGVWLQDDGLRLMPGDLDEWLKVDASFRDMLEARGIDYYVMSKEMLNIQDRVGIVRQLEIDGDQP
jgi:nicotinamide riboside kinase